MEKDVCPGLLGTSLPLLFGAENWGSLGSMPFRENGHRGAALEQPRAVPEGELTPLRVSIVNLALFFLGTRQ